MSALLFIEVREWNKLVPHLITTVRIAREANKDGNDQAAADRGITAYNQLVGIGHRLTADLVCGTTSLHVLLEKWNDHHYRPTLQAAAGTPEKLLADIYDLAAEVNGIDVTAYRAGYNADGYR